MAKRIFLHIGRHKTGTTAIQRAFQDNRGRLLSSGFRYPGAGKHHHALTYALGGNEDHAPEAAALRAEIDAAAGVVIVSSEGFVNVDPHCARSFFGDNEVTVVVYLREQIGEFASHYQQHVKAELERRTFEDYAGTMAADYMPFLDCWAGAFGKANMIVRPYGAGDVVADFCGVVGVDFSALTIAPDDANPSIAGALLEAKRRYNVQYDGDARALQDATYWPLIELAREHADYRGRAAAAPAFIEAVRIVHQPFNEGLARAYGVALPPTEFPAADPIADADVRIAWERLRERVTGLAALA